MRGAWLVVLAAGCSSTAMKSGDMRVGDMAAARDMMVPCTIAATGDVTETWSCQPFICRPVASMFDDINLAPGGAADAPLVDFTIAPRAEVRSYAGADLRGWDLRVSSGGKQWDSGNFSAGSSVTLRLTSVVASGTTNVCDGVVHGSGSAQLVGIDPTTGMTTGSGSVAVTFSF